MGSSDLRAQNRVNSTKLLTERGILFTTHNDGAHLIVDSGDGLIDFYPGTGKFRTRKGVEGRGVFKVIKMCNYD